MIMLDFTRANLDYTIFSPKNHNNNNNNNNNNNAVVVQVDDKNSVNDEQDKQEEIKEVSLTLEQLESGKVKPVDKMNINYLLNE
ncbi:MAG: hypothetical protein H6731_10725 [Myxococcales bacterium]|nr:MAG: hypothetical protein H6731_10725 [Myxococcales bacterium]